MYYIKRMALLLLVLSMATACAGTQPNTLTINKIIILFPDISTNVKLKREGWNQFISVGFGTILHPTDLIKSDGSGSILCPNLSIQPIPQYGRPPCSVDKGWLEYNEYEFASGPRGIFQDIPYVIFPRGTSLINSELTLQWHDTKASSYTVSILRDGEVLWEDANITKTSIQYPASAPRFATDVDYLLVIRDNDTGHSSLEDAAKGLGFEIIDDESRQMIEQRKIEILSQPLLDESARKLALALYYSNLEMPNRRKLWGEAWLTLEDVAKVRRAPAVYLQIGNVLSAMRLDNEAEIAYETAAELAETVGDIETEATANYSLWKLTGKTVYFDLSISLYEDLGEKIKIEELLQDNRGEP